MVPSGPEALYRGVRVAVCRPAGAISSTAPLRESSSRPRFRYDIFHPPGIRPFIPTAAHVSCSDGGPAGFRRARLSPKGTGPPMGASYLARQTDNYPPNFAGGLWRGNLVPHLLVSPPKKVAPLGISFTPSTFLFFFSIQSSRPFV